MEKEVYYLGLLANTDNSILNVTLEHGFKIKMMSEDEVFDILVQIDTDVRGMPFWVRFYDQHCIFFKYKRFFCIHNSIKYDLDLDSQGRLLINNTQSLSNLAFRYLSNVTQLMRLFKKGNVCIPFQYIYYVHNNTIKSINTQWTSLRVQKEPFVLKELDIAELQKSLKETKTPFNKPYLQLALELFELSYKVRNNSLSFLSLMIALEALFICKRRKISYTMRRNTAVLLGESEKESEEILSDIKKLYNKRSDIVHEGTMNIVDKSDVETLRNYVRRAIKKIYSMNIDKEDLFSVLNSYGFGQAGKLASWGE